MKRLALLGAVGSIALTSCSSDDGEAAQIATTEQAVATVADLSSLVASVGIVILEVPNPVLFGAAAATVARRAAGCPEVAFDLSCTGGFREPPCTLTASADYGAAGCTDRGGSFFAGSITLTAQATGKALGDPVTATTTLDAFRNAAGQTVSGTASASLAWTTAGVDGSLAVAGTLTDAAGVTSSLDLAATLTFDARGSLLDPTDDRLTLAGTLAADDGLGKQVDLAVDGFELDRQLCPKEPSGGTILATVVDRAQVSFTATVQFAADCTHTTTIGPAPAP